MKLKLSRTSIAILVVAFALAGYGLVSSNHDDSSADVAVAPRKVTRPGGNAGEPGGSTSQQHPSSRPDISSDGNNLSARIDLLQARTNQAEQIHDVFAVSVPVAPPAPPAPPPPKPTAPPFPYSIIGAMQDGPTRTLYLSRSDRVVIARSGLTIDGLYHVDNVGAQSLTVTYLPLHQQQIVSSGRGR